MLHISLSDLFSLPFHDTKHPAHQCFLILHRKIHHPADLLDWFKHFARLSTRLPQTEDTDNPEDCSDIPRNSAELILKNPVFSSKMIRRSENGMVSPSEITSFTSIPFLRIWFIHRHQFHLMFEVTCCDTVFSDNLLPEKEICLPYTPDFLYLPIHFSSNLLTFHPIFLIWIYYTVSVSATGIISKPGMVDCSVTVHLCPAIDALDILLTIDFPSWLDWGRFLIVYWGLHPVLTVLLRPVTDVRTLFFIAQKLLQWRLYLFQKLLAGGCSWTVMSYL